MTAARTLARIAPSAAVVLLAAFGPAQARVASCASISADEYAAAKGTAQSGSVATTTQLQGVKTQDGAIKVELKAVRNDWWFDCNRGFLTCMVKNAVAISASSGSQTAYFRAPVGRTAIITGGDHVACRLN